MFFLCPVLFSKVIGHAALKAKLIGNIREGRVPHAQLMVGPRGSGNLAMALAYAQYLLCENKGQADACGTCPSCIQMAKLEHPDLHLAFPIYLSEKAKTCDPFVSEWRSMILSDPYSDAERWRDHLEADNKQLNMGKGVASEMLRKLSLKSFRGGYKVLLIWLPEYMDAIGYPMANNMLLKVFEEPEPNTVILLVSCDPDQLLTTIISRAQMIRIPALPPAELGEALRERFPELSEADSVNLALRAEGDLLEAVEMAGKGEEELFVFFRDWLRHCYKREVVQAVEYGEQFQKMGRERQKSLVRYGLYLIRQCAMQWQQLPDLVRVLGQELEFVQNFSKLLNERNADGIRRELETAHVHIERNANPKVLFMDLSYRMMGLLRP